MMLELMAAIGFLALYGPSLVPLLWIVPAAALLVAAIIAAFSIAMDGDAL